MQQTVQSCAKGAAIPAERGGDGIEAGGLRGELDGLKNVRRKRQLDASEFRGAFVVLEPEPDKISRLFSELVAAGRKGYYITASRPGQIARFPSRGRVSYLWVNSSVCGAPEAANLDIGCKIERILDECEGGVVAVDRFWQSGCSGSMASMLEAVARKAESRSACLLLQMPGERLRKEERDAIADITGHGPL
jgi:hypothetical protein